MLIYEDRQNVIDAIRKRCEAKIEANAKVIAEHTPKQQITLWAMGEHAAYSDILWLLTDYQLRSD